MTEIKYYDIGVNLFSKQFKEPEKIIEETESAGVCCILTGSDIREDRKVAEFVRSHDVYGTAGIHPHNADRASTKQFEEIVKILESSERMVAVGECGLDYDRMFSNRENQKSCLKAHIEIAERLRKPMFLHERDASEDMVKCFEGLDKLCSRSVIHCFTGDKTTVEQYVDMGFYIGVTGWICDDRRAEALRAAVGSIPLNRILIETDAPYLTPRNVKGLDRINHPCNIKYVARELALYMGISEDELIRCAAENTRRLFGI